MKQISINGTKYNVYGKNEHSINPYPHIENAATGDVPQGEQMFLLKSYMAANNIPIKDKITTHECIRLVLKSDSGENATVEPRTINAKENTAATVFS